MLDKWLQTLEQEKQKVIDRIRDICKNTNIMDLATEEIELNYISVKNFLKRIAESGFEVNDDLSQVDAQYDGFEDYRRLYNHIDHHLSEMKHVPNRIEGKNFKPKLAKYY